MLNLSETPDFTHKYHVPFPSDFVTVVLAVVAPSVVESVVVCHVVGAVSEL